MTSEARPARSSEIVFGTNSPITTCKNVSSAKASASARLCTRIAARLPGSQSSMGLKICANVGFAQGAQAQAGERDADLHAGNDAIELGEQLLNHARAGTPLSDQLAHARDAHCYQREFRRRKESVDGHQRQRRASSRSPIIGSDSNSQRSPSNNWQSGISARTMRHGTTTLCRSPQTALECSDVSAGATA